MSAALQRSFGADPGSDRYGRHALVNPGGDDRQVDVVKLVGTDGPIPINLNSVSPSYVGRHAIDRASSLRVAGTGFALTYATEWHR